MPAASTAITSVESLKELQNELISMSENLNDLYDMINTALSTVNEHWSDSKFEEFEEEFRSSKELIDELSKKYEDWAKSYIQQRIDVLIKVGGVGFS